MFVSFSFSRTTRVLAWAAPCITRYPRPPTCVDGAEAGTSAGEAEDEGLEAPTTEAT